MPRIELTSMKAVVYGQPANEALADEVSRLDVRRILILASGTLNRETDEVEKLQTALGPRCAGVFDRVGAHVPRQDVIAATHSAREADVDLIVTIGGGSPTDAAKAVSLCLANGIDRPRDIDRLLTKVDTDGHPLPPDFKAPIIPQISIPTTLSAGEYSAITGVTNEATGQKDILKHPGMMPHMAILDPDVARHTPEWLFLSTGIRAIDHCVEGICSQTANPFGDAQALRGLELLAKGLAAVKNQPDDRSARLDCLLGAWLSMGPLVSGVPMGASHGIGYVLGARFGIPHGHTSCLMLPAVMEWNASVNSDRQRLVSAALGEAETDASVLLDALISGLGLPRGLLANGITIDDFDDIAGAAMLTPWVPKNPRQINGPEDVLEILALAQ
ncbi:MAG: iron-containing alcohol dehydrogenase [Shimia thalassica]|uniref:iron-containing alcohol dehydrogenase n=1 Tax=Shimia thalassica TaxID=1715693 RepID=UPI0032974C2C